MSLTHKLIKWSVHPNHPKDVSARHIYLRQSKLTDGRGVTVMEDGNGMVLLVELSSSEGISGS